jgi:hypothetical protein
VNLPICRSCPIRVEEKRLFWARHRCGIHGRYIDLSAGCTLSASEAAVAKQFLSRVLVSKISDAPKP